MLDDLNELRILQQVLAHGSLMGAARALGVSLAVVSKRLATLERRAGVRLVNRTTRSLSPTEEGERLLVEVDRALEAIGQAEEMLTSGRDEPIGTLRVSAPVSFGRRHVAPVLGQLAERHPRLAVSLSLDDRLVDVVGGTFDVAIRIGGLFDTSATMLKLADNRRVLAASPAYLDRHGRPDTPDALANHAVLRYGDGSMSRNAWGSLPHRRRGPRSRAGRGGGAGDTAPAPPPTVPARRRSCLARKERMGAGRGPPLRTAVELGSPAARLLRSGLAVGQAVETPGLQSGGPATAAPAVFDPLLPTRGTTMTQADLSTSPGGPAAPDGPNMPVGAAHLPPQPLDLDGVEDGAVVFENWKGEADGASPPPPPRLRPARPVGFALLGLGRLALEEILPAFAHRAKSSPAALISGSPEKARAVAVQHGIPADRVYGYDEWHRLAADPAIQAVYVVSPNGRHRDHVLAAAGASS